MIKKIEIENFKNFERFEFDGFRRVNLIAGKNNVGKTNLMEAIYFHQHNFNPAAVVQSVLLRMESFDSKKFAERNVAYLNFLLEKGLKRFFRDAGNQDIKVRIDSQSSIVKIRNFTTVWVLFEGKQFGRNQPLDSIEDGKNPQMLIVEGADYPYQKPFGLPLEDLASKALETKNRVGLILPTNPSRFQEGTLGQLKKEDLFGTLLEMLRSILPGLKDLFFIEESSGDKVLWLLDGDKTYPFTQLGFGSNRLLQIYADFLVATRSEDRMLLVDEIDLGLHYTVQEKVWEVLFYWAKKLNVQLFATTHSRDCVDAFARVSNKFQGEGQYLRLQERNSSIQAVSYDEEERLRALDVQSEMR